MTASKKSGRRRRRQAPPKGFKVRRPDELLAIIPYLVGFHPDESIVAVFIQSGRVVLAARIDLPPESEGDELAAQIEYLAKRHEASALALVAYSAASLPAHRLLTRLMDRLGKHKLADVLYVGQGRWWSLTCGEDCCPLNGTPFDLSSHPLSAAAVFAGLSTRVNRQELAASISGPPETELPRLQGLAETLLTEREHFDDSSAAARLMVSLVDTAVSDPGALNERHSLLLGPARDRSPCSRSRLGADKSRQRGGACPAVGRCSGEGAADVGGCTVVPAGRGRLAVRSGRTTELLLRTVGTG